MSKLAERLPQAAAGRDLVVLGFFPPPITGQSIWTDQFAKSMASGWDVRRVNQSPVEDEGLVRWKGSFSWHRLKHYLQIRTRVVDELASAPHAPIVWSSISPTTLGHYRDLATILPAFTTSQRVFAAAHWGSFARLFSSPKTRLTSAKIVDRIDGFVFVDEMLSEACAPWIRPAQRHVIRNTVGEDMLVSTEEALAKVEAAAGRKELRVLFMSNMIKEKGYLDLLGALSIMQDRSLPFRATFAGGWESRHDEMDFHDRLRDGELADRVRHLGTVSDRNEVKRLFLYADVLVLPTYMEEAQPLTIIEALNAAVPVVATRAGGIPRMVDHGKEGLLVETRDPGGIADALSHLADRERWRKLARGARGRFERTFHPSIITAQWNQLLSGAV